MDAYTDETKAWLDRRFSETDAAGVYFAHQPIYGFREGHCEDNIMRRYIITYQIMNALGRLQFDSLLDVGGAEGYKAALVREIFGVAVRSCDLSAAASTRAKEIFNVPGEAVDIANLPYEDGAFDVVLCSETLEHVVDIRAATRELIRVARKAVVITVPKESPEEVERNLREKVPHGHIHALDLDSFAWVKEQGVEVLGHRISSRGLLSFPMQFVQAEPTDHAKYSPRAKFLINRLLVPIARAVTGKRAASFLLQRDDTRARLREDSRGLLFILLKDRSVLRAQPVFVAPRLILDFRVPLHYPARAPL